MSKAVTVVVVGAGSRGSGYMQYSLDLPDKLKCVGVADPKKFYRERVRETYHVEEANVFDAQHHLADEVSSDASMSRLTGHGGADFYAMDAFVSAVQMNDPSLVLTGPTETLRSHLLCFQAEKARVSGTFIHNPEDGPFDGL